MKRKEKDFVIIYGLGLEKKHLRTVVSKTLI